MSESHFEIPRTAGYKFITVLVAVIIGICCWVLDRYLDAEVAHEKAQTSRMDTAQQSIQATTQVQEHVLRKIVRLEGADATHAANARAHHKPVAVAKPQKPDGS